MAKEIIVTIVTTRRKSQRFTFTIDDGSGPDMAVKEYYTRAYTAKRGALRHLKGSTRPIIFKRKKN